MNITATETQDSGSIESVLDNIIQIEEPVAETEEEENDLSSEEPNEEESETSENESEDESSEEDESDDHADEDSDEEGKDEEADAGSETLYTVKVDGSDVQVSLDDLKQGYSGQKYVQQGMQENAQTKKQVSEVYQALLSERQHIAQLLEQVGNEGLPKAPEAPSRELFDADPIGYMEQKLKYDEDVATYQQQMAQLESVREQQTQANSRMTQQYVQEQAGKLVEKIPGLADEKQAKGIESKMKDAALSLYGFSEQEYNGVVDHRAMHILHDAMKYREIIAGKEKADSKARDARPVIKPGAKKPTGRKSANDKRMQKLRQTGSIDDAVALILNS